MPSTLAPQVVLAKEYRLIEQIGEGGMGTVWLAHDEVMHRDVAIKLLHERLARDPKANARFRQEARAAARLRHPNICGVIDVGEHEGTPFIVMPRLKGDSLAVRLARAPALTPREAVDIAMAVLRALHAAHTSSVLHRDLKPANVFLAEEDGGVVPKVLDFGTAKFLAEPDDENLTRTGVVIGTPAYMSPEQAKGERGVDARADVWGAGMLLYEALSGRLPYEANNSQAMVIKVATEAPRQLALVAPGVDPDLAAIVMRALAFKAEDRYPSAWAFAAPLRDWAAREHPGAATPAGRTPTPPRPSGNASVRTTGPMGTATVTQAATHATSSGASARPSAAVTQAASVAGDPRPSVSRIPPPPSLPRAGGPTVRALLAQQLVQALRRHATAARVLAAVPRDVIARIEDAPADAAIEFELLAAVCEWIYVELGPAGLRQAVRETSLRFIEEATRQEWAGTLSVPTPVTLLMRTAATWNRLFVGAGVVRFESRVGPGRATLVWQDIPTECRDRQSARLALAAALEGVLDLLGVPGSVIVGDRDPLMAAVRFVATWEGGRSVQTPPPGPPDGDPES